MTDADDKNINTTDADDKNMYVTDADDKKKLWNFKEFVEKTPCVRNAFLHGISGGLGVGAAAFLYSKHIRRSCDVAVASFVLVSLGSWQVCRYMNNRQKREIQKAFELLNQYKDKTNKDESVST